MWMIIIDGHYLMHVNMLSMKNRPRRIATYIYLCFYFTFPIQPSTNTYKVSH